VREDLTKLVPVLQDAPLRRFRSLAPGARTIPVLRLSGNVRRLEGSPGLTVLGLPARDIPSLRWRSDYSSLSRDEIAQRLRPSGGINAAAVARGTLRLGRPRVDGREVALDFAHWVATGGLTASGGGRIQYVVTGDAVARFRARQPTDDHPVPIVASPRLAAAAGPGGVLPLDVGTSTIVGRVVGLVRRIPTVDEHVVMADGPTLATALNTAAPGSG